MKERNKRFGARVAARPGAQQVQLDGVDSGLSVRLWNFLFARELRLMPETNLNSWEEQADRQSQYKVGVVFWCDVMEMPAQEVPKYPADLLAKIHAWWEAATWFQVYEAVEWFLELKEPKFLEGWRNALNRVLAAEGSGYRAVDRLLAPVTDAVELEALREGAPHSGGDPFGISREHLANGAAHAFNRENPDYANAVKEAMCAIEVALGVAVGEPGTKVATALAMLERGNVITGALKTGWSAMYGFASEEGGIRHGRTGDRQVTFADAKYFLVSASAFVNWLAGQAVERGLPMVKAGNATVPAIAAAADRKK